MEAITTDPFESLTIPKDIEFKKFKNTLLVTKLNWQYENFLAFQKEAQSFIAKNRSLRVIIICNHPYLYTMGRGNERGEDNLLEFNAEEALLPFPLHNIHRGGGVTFHHPGQWICYPIVAIKESYNLDDHMCWLLKSVAKILKEDFRIEKILTAKKLMGIWYEKKKLASIGVGVNRFVTEHGLALNLAFDDIAEKGLRAISPCGLNSEVYFSVEQVLNANYPTDTFDLFTEKFLDLLVDPN